MNYKECWKRFRKERFGVLTDGTERTNAHASIPWPKTTMAQRAWQDPDGALELRLRIGPGLRC